jgi:hypothetical protein
LSSLELTPDEIANGWDAQSLAAYRRDRDKVADVVPGNIVTEFKRPKAMMKIEGAGRNYSPFTRRVR